MAGDATGPDDYDRACAVDGLAGVIPVGESGAQALVLADEPATSCYLPEHRAFLRWLAASSEAGLRAAAEGVLADPAITWEECGSWVSNGPAVLMDSAEAGSDLDIEYPGGGMPEQTSVPLPAGRWRVRAIHIKADGDHRVGLVQILPLPFLNGWVLRVNRSRAARKVVQMGDAERRMVDTLSLRPAVAQALARRDRARALPTVAQHHAPSQEPALLTRRARASQRPHRIARPRVGGLRRSLCPHRRRSPVLIPHGPATASAALRFSPRWSTWMMTR